MMSERIKIPAIFTTTIYLGLVDRIRVLWHGKIVYNGTITPDPEEFDVSVKIRVPHMFTRSPKIGYEEGSDNEC